MWSRQAGNSVCEYLITYINIVTASTYNTHVRPVLGPIAVQTVDGQIANRLATHLSISGPSAERLERVTTQHVCGPVAPIHGQQTWPVEARYGDESVVLFRCHYRSCVRHNILDNTVVRGERAK